MLLSPCSGHGAAVEKLPVRARGGEAALEQERAALARLRADFLQRRVDLLQPRRRRPA